MEDARIRFSNINDRSIWVESVPLTIRPPDVTVVTPAGGTTWHVGDTVSVHWTTVPAPPAGGLYWIDLCKGGVCHHSIALVSAGAFGHSWVLSGDDEPGDDDTVRLCLTGCCDSVKLAESAAFAIR